jgi:hypothetical protein
MITCARPGRVGNGRRESGSVPMRRYGNRITCADLGFKGAQCVLVVSGSDGFMFELLQ